MIPINCTGDDVDGRSSVTQSDSFSFSGVLGPGVWVPSRRVSGGASKVNSWSKEVGRAEEGKAGEGGETGVTTIPRGQLEAFEGSFRVRKS